MNVWLWLRLRSGSDWLQHYKLRRRTRSRVIQPGLPGTPLPSHRTPSDQGTEDTRHMSSDLSGLSRIMLYGSLHLLSLALKPTIITKMSPINNSVLLQLQSLCNVHENVFAPCKSTIVIENSCRGTNFRLSLILMA